MRDMWLGHYLMLYWKWVALWLGKLVIVSRIRIQEVTSAQGTFLGELQVALASGIELSHLGGSYRGLARECEMRLDHFAVKVD